MKLTNENGKMGKVQKNEHTYSIMHLYQMA